MRPERISLTAEKPVEAEAALQAKVYDTAYLGQDLKVHLKLIAGNIDIEVRVTSTEAERNQFTPGQTLWCSWPCESGLCTGPLNKVYLNNGFNHYVETKNNCIIS